MIPITVFPVIARSEATKQSKIAEILLFPGLLRRFVSFDDTDKSDFWVLMILPKDFVTYPVLILAIKALKPGNCKVFDLSGNIKQGLAYATNCN